MAAANPPVLRPPSSADNTTTVNPPCTGCTAGTVFTEPHPPHRSYVHFRHPGYDDSHNLMFRLEAFDRHHTHQSHGVACPDSWGVHHGTALRACSVIACNLDGFLSITRLPSRTSTTTVSGSPPYGATMVTHPHLDEVLTGTTYYFYALSGSDEIYPVCPGFSHWPFPHTNVPLEWTELYVSYNPPPFVLPHIFSDNPADSRNPILKPRTYQPLRSMPLLSPGVTAHAVSLVTGTAPKLHILFRERSVTGYVSSLPPIPNEITSTHTDAFGPTQFIRNEMHQYNLNLSLTSSYLTSDVENCLRLRGDVHTALDRGDFVIVPKCGSSYVHMLKRTVEYGRLYHNRATQDIHVTCEFLYARFAWAIIPMASVFASKEGVLIQNYDSASNSWKTGVVTPPLQQVPNKRRRGIESTGGSAAAVTVLPSSAADGGTTGVVLAHQVPSEAVGFRPPSPAEVFEKMVAAYPQRAWERSTWHPETPRMIALREEYLCAHEPLHAAEVNRQNSILDAGGTVSDCSSESGTEKTLEVCSE